MESEARRVEMQTGVFASRFVRVQNIHLPLRGIKHVAPHTFGGFKSTGDETNLIENDIFMLRFYFSSTPRKEGSVIYLPNNDEIRRENGIGHLPCTHGD